MGLQKDADTGSFILTAAKAVQSHRLRRKKYAKHDLAARRSGFLTWLTSLFTTDPFIGSPIASQIAKRTRLVKASKSAQATGTGMDDSHFTVIQLRGELHDHLTDAETEADTYIDPLTTALDQEEAFLDECRPEKIRAGLDTELQKELDGLNAAFTPLARKAAEDKIHLDNFKSMHGLPNTFYWGDFFTTGNIGLIMGVIVFEFLLNSIFFAAANPMGMIGGASLALVLSLATVFLGVSLGIAYQFNHPRSEGGGWVGKALFVLVPLAILFFLLLLTLARQAGESGDLKMFASAAIAIQQRPFSGLFDLPSLGYFFFSIGVITYTAFKYVSIMGRFPGLRRRVLHAQASEQEFDAEVSGAGDHFRGLAEAQIEALDSLPMFIQQTVLPMKDIEMDFENVIDQHRNDCISIGNSAKLLFSYVNLATGSRNIEVDSFARNECAASIVAHQVKLEYLRDRIRKLVQRDEIQPATIDRCRDAMNEAVQRALDTLGSRCSALKETQYREKQVEMADNPANVSLVGAAA